MTNGRLLTDNDSWEVDVQLWPVMVIKRLTSAITDEQLRASLDASDQMLDSHAGKYSLVLDNSLSGPMGAEQRKIIAEHMDGRKARTRERCLGTAFVITSPLVRGFLTAIFWLSKPETETKTFGAPDEALQWAQSRHSDISQATGGRAYLLGHAHGELLRLG